MIKVRLAIIVLFFASKTAFSQSAEQTVNQAIEWFSVNSTIKVHEKVNLYVEGNFRFAQNFDPQQNQIRTAIEFGVIKNLSIIPAGYVYTWNYAYGKQPAHFVNNEHRFYQQISYKHSVGRVYFQHRVRLEERFLQSHHLTTEGIQVGDTYDDERFRFRYRASVHIPLNHTKVEENTVFVSVWDEIFASWGKRVFYHSPDQNRIFVGVGYQFTKMMSMQAGGFYQMLKKSNGLQQENNIGGLVQLTYNLDFTKHANN